MSAPPKLIRRLFLSVVALLLIFGIAAPFVTLNRLTGRIKIALQNSLHRRVDIGDVHLNLFTGPGFTVENVLIYEDPSIGIEPFASVLSLEARVRLSYLWTGTWNFLPSPWKTPALISPSRRTLSGISFRFCSKPTPPRTPPVYRSSRYATAGLTLSSETPSRRSI